MPVESPIYDTAFLQVQNVNLIMIINIIIIFQNSFTACVNWKKPVSKMGPSSDMSCDMFALVLTLFSIFKILRMPRSGITHLYDKNQMIEIDLD